MSYSKSQIFLLCAIMFIVGVGLGSWQSIPEIYTYVSLALLITAGAIAYAAGSKRVAIFFMMAAFFVVGVWRITTSFQPSEYASVFGQKVELEAVVVEEPDVRVDRQLLTIRPLSFNQRVLVTTTRAQEFFYGDRVYVSGKINEPKVYDDFDYKGYLERYKVYGIASYPKLLILKSHQLSWWYERVLRIKVFFVTRISGLLPEPKGSLLLGVLIGARRGLPQDVTDDFTQTGLSHIVAASGYNMSVIVSGLGFLAYLVGRRWSAVFALVCMFIFVLLAGASASVVRAAVMSTLLLLAFSIGRLYSAGPAICIAAAGMLLLNPKILYWDVGFQLSFAATMGIVYGNPILEKLTENWPKLIGGKTILITTCTATLATLPFVLLHFGRLSLVVLPANMLVLPLIPWVMAFGALTIVPLIGTGFAFVSSLLLEYILWIAHTFARLPFSSVDASLPLWGFWLYLAGLVGVYVWLHRKLYRVEYYEGV